MTTKGSCEMTDVVAWAAVEMEERVRAGKSTDEAADEVKALADEFGYGLDFWRAMSRHLLIYIFYQSIRNKRMVEGRNEVPALPATVGIVETQPRVFGNRRVDVALLSKPAAIFDAVIYVGTPPSGRNMRYGDMRREDWESKERDYLIREGAARTRACACARIAKHLIGDLTTEECISEEEFKRLIPAIGF